MTNRETTRTDIEAVVRRYADVPPGQRPTWLRAPGTAHEFALSLSLTLATDGSGATPRYSDDDVLIGWNGLALRDEPLTPGGPGPGFTDPIEGIAGAQIADDPFVRLPRDMATGAVIELLERRDVYVVVPPPSAEGFCETLRRLERAGVTGWVAYVDVGGADVLRCHRLATVEFVNEGALCFGVIAVPKTVTPVELDQALGADLGGDPVGDQTMIALTTDDGYTGWPQLVVDALDVLDPASAAEIRETTDALR